MRWGSVPKPPRAVAWSTQLTRTSQIKSGTSMPWTFRNTRMSTPCNLVTFFKTNVRLTWNQNDNKNIRIIHESMTFGSRRTGGLLTSDDFLTTKNPLVMVFGKSNPQLPWHVAYVKGLVKEFHEKYSGQALGGKALEQHQKKIWGFPKMVGFPPKSAISMGCSILNHPFWCTPIFANTHMNFSNSTIQ